MRPVVIQVKNDNPRHRAHFESLWYGCKQAAKPSLPDKIVYLHRKGFGNGAKGLDGVVDGLGCIGLGSRQSTSSFVNPTANSYIVMAMLVPKRLRGVAFYIRDGICI
jgi:hypothetical protein